MNKNEETDRSKQIFRHTHTSTLQKEFLANNTNIFQTQVSAFHNHQMQSRNSMASSPVLEVQKSSMTGTENTRNTMSRTDEHFTPLINTELVDMPSMRSSNRHPSIDFVRLRQIEH